MDAETIAALSGLLAKGGNVALFVAVWVAWRAGKLAGEATNALKEIRDAAVGSKPVLEKVATAVDDIDRRSLSIDNRAAGIDMKVSAILANSQKGT